MDVFPFFIAICAFIYAIVVEKRRKRDAEGAEELVKQVASLTARIHKLESERGAHAVAQPAAVRAADASPIPATPVPQLSVRPPAAPAPFGTPKPAELPAPVAHPQEVSPQPMVPTQPSAMARPAVEPPKPATIPPAPPPAIKPAEPVPPAGPATTPKPEAKPAEPLIAPVPSVPALRPLTPPAPNVPAPAAPSVSPGLSARVQAPVNVLLHAPASAPPAPPLVPAQPPKSKRKITFSMEETLGRNWLPRLGITMLVIGVAMWTATQFKDWFTKPWVQISLCYLGGFGMLAGGVVLERKENFKVLGRALIGGGWAIIFFFTFVIGNVEGFKFVSPAVDLFLMLLVAGVMVWHTLRYNSQLVTGCAFLLGFTAVAISHTSAFSMIAGLILVSGMTVLVLRRQWYELEVFGILASFLNHFYWLSTIIGPAGDKFALSDLDYRNSAALLVAYWIIFRFSYLWRTISDKQQESVSTIAAVVSPVLFMAIMRYQSHHPELAFYALLAMGAMEFTLGQLPVARRRRMPFLMLSSLGAILMVAAVPIKFAGRHALEIIWLAGAEAFLLAGVFAREKLFRYFGIIVSALVALTLVPTQLVPLAAKTLEGQQHLAPIDSTLCLVLAMVAATFYVNSHIITRLWPGQFESETERGSMTALSFAASVLAVASIYAGSTYKWSAIVLALLITLLSWSGRRFRILELLYQSHWIALVAVIDACINDKFLQMGGTWLRIPLGIAVLSVVAGLLYVSSRFVRLSAGTPQETAAVLYKWAASGMIGLLIAWHAGDWIAVDWMAFALVLAIVGQIQKLPEFRWQALVFAVLSFFVAMAVNLEKTGTVHLAGANVNLRLLSVGLVSAGMYALTRWSPMPILAPFYKWAGTILLGAVAWKETHAEWTAVAWIALATAVGIAARFWKDRALLWQTHVAAAAAVLWMLFTNFQPFYNGTRQQLVAVFVTAALLYALNWITHIPGVIEDTRISFVYSWAGTLLLSVLVFNDAAPQWVATLWIGMAVVLALIARYLKGRLLLWQTHVLSLAATAWTLWANFPGSYKNSHDLWLHWLAVGSTAALLYLLTWLTNIEGVIEDSRLCSAYPWAGTLLLGWLAFKDAHQWTAVAWVVMAVCLAAAARYWKDRSLLWQTHLLAVVAAGWAMAFNLIDWHGDSKIQLIAVSVTLLLLYGLAWLTDDAEIIGDRRIARAYPWAGSALVSWLAWYQLQPHTRSLAWGILGLLLFEVGCELRLASLRGQGYIALASSFVYIFFANFNGSAPETLLDPRMVAVYPLAAIYFWTYHRLHEHEKDFAKP
ncbi:MAG TPA: DUF2339 domain-containing protein [Candidatus Saccharimonadales bacterium]|jgi:hypothetical protein|nr:DUF2339 domain-containing protein [Candidatus Saccharimonadales bacterium]